MNPFDPYNPQGNNNQGNNPGNYSNNNPNNNLNYNPNNNPNYNPNYNQGNHTNPEGQELNPFARPTFTSLNQYESYADYDPYAGMNLPGNTVEAEKRAGKNSRNEKKKSKLGLILGISAGGLAAAAVLVLWLGGFLHSKSGKYVWDDYQVFGMMVELSIDGSEGEIKISADGKEQTQKCSVEFYEDKVELTMNGKYLICNYDRKRQTITVPDDTYLKGDIVLEKD